MLGSAKIIISIDDEEGLVVRHGQQPDVILASLPAAECNGMTWDRLWYAIEDLGARRSELVKFKSV